MDAQQQLLELFITESAEIFEQLEAGLVALESNPGDNEAIHGVFRSAHTLKGNAGMVGLTAVVEVAHVLEGVLERVRSHHLVPERALVSDLLAALDLLRSMVAEVASSGTCGSPPEADAVFARLARWQAPGDAHAGPTSPSAPVAAVDGERTWEIELRFRPDILSTGQDPAMFLRELAELGTIVSVDTDTAQVPPIDQLEPTSFHLGWRVVLRTAAPRSEIEAVFLFVLSDNPISIRELGPEAAATLAPSVPVAPAPGRAPLAAGAEPAPAAAPEASPRAEAPRDPAAPARSAQATNIRVDTDKLDRLVNLVGELVIAVAQVNQKTRDAHASLEARVTAVETLEQISRDLQEQVMSVRMVPVRDTFERFRRAVRDLAGELGREVLLETAGTETELDKNVIEQLVDPLKHMVRNAIAHGIETPPERLAAGKSPTGTLALRASQREGHIVIEVADDGRGVDPELVLTKARARGLVAEDQALAHEEILDLLFAPGFSTAATVDEVSGRGVGLDVVRRNVEALRGTVTIESRKGHGTTFRIRLPLTLAIIEGMNVRAGRETVIVPLLSVLELIEPAPGVVQTIEGRGEVVDLRGELLPIARLAPLLGLERDGEAAPDPKIVVVENDGRHFGLLVDRVLGLEQAVIKPLSKSFALIGHMQQGFARPRGLAGATILGDGSVGLIADLGGLERMAFAA